MIVQKKILPVCARLPKNLFGGQAKPGLRFGEGMLLLVILLSFVIQACSTFQQLPTTVQNQIDSLLISDFFKSSQAAISVYDLTDKKSLYQFNEKLLLRPASNQKILTTAAAYLFLGTDYKFTTSVYRTGEIIDSVCNGDLFVVGGFDPDFTSVNLDSLVKEIKHLGIKTITGNIYADVSAMDSLFWGEGWMWDDDPASYAAYLTPLSINKNSIKIAYEPNEVEKPAGIELIPRTDFFQINNSSFTVDTGKSELTISRDWLNRNNKISVHGTLLRSAKRDTISLNVFNPTFYFLNLMKESFERNGISVEGKLDTLTLNKAAAKIFSFEHDINRVIVNTNKTSDNLSAEMLLRALAFKSSGAHSSAKNGIALVDSLISLSGLNPKDYMIVDGSGLSFYNLLSAELLTEILKYLYYQQPNLFQKMKDSFPISGYDGTLVNRMKDSATHGQVFAKTGTIRGASSLSGYLRNKNNHMIAFSILIQNYTGSSNHAKSLQDNICRIIFETN